MFGAMAAFLAFACLLAILFRTNIATIVLRQALAGQGSQSEIVVDSIGFGGATAHGTFSQPGLTVSFTRAVVHFDRRQIVPRVAAVEITSPIVTVDPRRLAGNGAGSASLGEMNIAVSEARIIALTGAGRLEIVGDARISGGRPQNLNAVLLPAHVQSGPVSAEIKGGRLSGVATSQGMHVKLALSGDVSIGRELRLDRTTINLNVPALSWNNKLAARVPSATMSLTAAGEAQGALEARLSAVEIDPSQATASAEITANAKLALPPRKTEPALNKVPLLASDRQVMRGIQTALQTLTAHARFSWHMAKQQQRLRLLETAELKGGDTLLLRLAPTTIDMRGTAVSGSLAANLIAPGVPQLDVTLASFTAAPGALTATLALKARMSLGALRNGEFEAQATAQMRNEALELHLTRCAAFKLGAYGSKRGALFAKAAGTLCASGETPLLRASTKDWTLQGEANALGALLPSSGLQISRGNAQFSLTGASAMPRDGMIRLAAIVSDANKTQRLSPERISGTVAIAGTTARASLVLSAGPHATPIGTISATHHLDSGAGSAALEFPSIAFAPQGLQPAHILPMFAMLAQADGKAAFSGRATWTAKRLTSSGRLEVNALRFSSPLGPAQQLSTHMLFTSLVPLKTAANQRIAIARVDWVQPLTGSATEVTLSPTQLRAVDTRTDVAGGEIAITPLDIPLKAGARFHGTVRISHLALGKLIAASNLGDKLKLEGSVSGSLPFTFGPEGLRFANGRIEADGPGRLSISHTLWGKGETNSVEKAAYQALENLSFQSLSASLDSVPGGRLRAVFRVVGYDDSPGTSHAEFKLADLLTGKAFQKEIPIPRGTGVNLTLDTSLNFDELLRGYQTTWSQMKALNGASP